MPATRLRARTKGTGCVIGYIKGAIQKGVWLATPFLARPPKARWSFVHMYFLIYHRNIIWSRRCGIEVRGELYLLCFVLVHPSLWYEMNHEFYLERWVDSDCVSCDIKISTCRRSVVSSGCSGFLHKWYLHFIIIISLSSVSLSVSQSVSQSNNLLLL